MPGRREFGVLDIKAESLDLAVPLCPQPRLAAPLQGRGLWAPAVHGARVWSPRSFSNASPGPATGPVTLAGPGAEFSLTACLLPLSQNPLSSPFGPGLRGPGGAGGELSGATTPCPQWTNHSSSQGWALEVPGWRVPLPSATRSLVGGDPKAILGRAPEEGPA